MTLCAFVGDELTAAGFRLAGAETFSPAAAEVPTLFRSLLDGYDLLILTAEAAAEVPPEQLHRSAARGRPLLLVVPDARGRQRPPDLVALLRGQLGMAE
jgi:vacuolar-type H+-ATPase subunit F/Vma7